MISVEENRVLVTVTHRGQTYRRAQPTEELASLWLRFFVESTEPIGRRRVAEADRRLRKRRWPMRIERPRKQVKRVVGQGVCPSCGDEFDKGSHQQRFCSDTCRNRYNNRKLKPARKTPTWKIEIACPSCGETFVRRAAHHQYCSARCRDRKSRE